MATAGPLLPTVSATSSAIGTKSWTSASNALTSNNTYATSILGSEETENTQIFDYRVSLIKADGTIGSTNKALAEEIGETETTRSYGGATELWGETWTRDDINDADFGVALSYQGVSTYDGPDITHYLKLTDFGFSLPLSAVVLGILVNVEVKATHVYPDRGSAYTDTVHVDSATITVFYQLVVDDPRPVANIINTVKASFGELWSTITSTWASETRTWQATGSLFDNNSKPSSSITNTPKP